MSGIELAAAAIFGAQLLDAKYHVKEDLALLRKVVQTAVPYLYNVSRKRASFWYMFEKAAKKYPDNNAISFPRPNKLSKARVDAEGFPVYDNQFSLETYTYREFYSMILKLSWMLKNEYDVTLKDTIAIDCMNKPLIILLWFSLWNIGAVPAFLNYNTKDKPLVHCIKIADVKQVFIDPDCAEPIKNTESMIKEQLPHVSLNYLDEDALLKRLQDPYAPEYRAPDSSRRPNDSMSSCCALIYTSGTTGLPKSAIMSWRKAFMACGFFGNIMRIDSKSTVMTAMPIYHSTAAMLGVCPTLSKGGCVSICQKFSASTFWTQAKLVGATHIQYVGEVCRYLLNAKPHPDEKKHQVKIAYGNGLRRDIWLEFKSRFGIEAVGEFYASTESPIATTNLQYGDFGVGACRKYGSLITNVLNTTQALVKMDPEDDSELLRNSKTGFCISAAIDEPGELLMKIMDAKNIEDSFQGYYGNKKATYSKIIRNVFKKGDAWFRSGDLLRMDEDGLLYFVDRLGDTFRWKSENVSATEVENEIMSTKTAKQAVVVGVRVPNHEGRAGFAVVDPAEGVSDEEVLQKLYTHTSATLPKYAVPQFVKIGANTIESSHNHKVPKNQFKNQKLPKGETGTELIYWLNKNRYEELTEDSWKKIMSGAAKL